MINGINTYSPGVITAPKTYMPLASGEAIDFSKVRNSFGVPADSSYNNPVGIELGNLPSMAPTGTIDNILAGGPAGTGSGVGGALSGLFDTLTGSDLIQTGLSAAALQDQMSRLSDIGTGLATGARELGEEAQAGTAFRPFTVSTGFGGVTTTPEGGYATTLDPSLAGQQQQLQALTGGLIGGMGAGIPDVSGIQRQALGGVGGFLTGAMAPMAQREADVYERIRATQRPEEQRQQLALNERLAAQGRTGLRTAQFGGSPEQFALAQAQEEAKARASLGALGQAQAEQLQQMGLAESMFGLGGRAAGLPQALQAGQLGNIGAAMGLQYLPEQQLLSTLTPGISLADIAGTGQRQGAGYLAQAGTTGLEALGQTEIARANLLRDLYSGLLAQQTSAETGERQESIAGGLFGDLLAGIGNIFTG